MKYASRRLASCLSGAFALLLLPSISGAVTVTNRDDKDYKLTIIEGESKMDHTLKPTGTLENVCLKGCVVRLNDSENDEYELEGTEVVSIEDGYLYYDGPDAPAEQAPGAPPAAPKQQ